MTPEEVPQSPKQITNTEDREFAEIARTNLRMFSVTSETFASSEKQSRTGGMQKLTAHMQARGCRSSSRTSSSLLELLFKYL